MAKSAQSAPESAAPAPGASDSGSAPEAADAPARSAEQAPAPAPQMPAEHVLLRFTGDKLVVLPFGELEYGDVRPAPRAILASLLATGLFTEQTTPGK